MTPALLSERLLAWYRAHRRVLPWREQPTPYHVLLSELMLQQTRVETVIPYFERFVARWPTVEALAAADVDDVLHAWAGLGYYSRARNLHRAAQAAASQGGIPSTPDALRALPGIGPYTAGAIASIAFGVPEPAIDGNVERVISRLDARGEDPRSPAGRRALDARVRELLAGAPPNELNQAFMELGATVCTPRNPSCATCPWSEGCQARSLGRPTEFPIARKKTEQKPIAGVCGILSGPHGVLLGRRPPGLLGGLWEPLRVPLADGADAEATLIAAFRDQVGLSVRVRAHLGEVIHVFSHRRLRLQVYAVSGPTPDVVSVREEYEAARWVDPDAPEVALSTLARKTLALSAGPQLTLLAADSG